MTWLRRLAVSAATGTAALACAAVTLAGTTPTVSSVSPQILPSSGGTLTLTGSGLSGTQSVVIGQVAIAGHPCVSPSDSSCFTALSDTSLTVQAGTMSAGTADVVVNAAGASSATSTADELTVAPPAPVITSITPASGWAIGGQSVTLRGTGLFAPGSGPVEVDFGTARVPFRVNPDSSMTVVTPRATVMQADVRVVVQSDDGTVGRSSPAGAVTFVFGVAPPPGPIRWLPLAASAPSAHTPAPASTAPAPSSSWPAPGRSGAQAWPTLLANGLQGHAAGPPGGASQPVSDPPMSMSSPGASSGDRWPASPDHLLEAWSTGGLWNGPLDLTALLGGASALPGSPAR